MVDVMTIQADLDVLNHYHKQKSEFHFQQKSDNDFLMFLLDTAVRVISIVQHLAPVIEAVSAASTDPPSDIVSDGDSGSVNNPITNNLMEVDSVIEEHQLSLEIPSVPLPPPPVKTTDTQHCQIPQSFSQNISPEQLNTITELEKEIQSVTETLSAAESYPPITDSYSSRVSLSEHIRPSVAPSFPEQTCSVTAIDTPNQTEFLKTDIKPEVPIAEVVEIKEELIETPHFSTETSSLSQILSSDHINQLMSSVVGSDNFNTSSSSTPPSYVAANKAANPLSMLHLQNNNAVLGSSLATSSEQMSLMNALFPNKEGILSGSDPGPSSGLDKKNISGISPASNSIQSKTVRRNRTTMDRHIATLRGFMIRQAEERPPEQIPAKHLDLILCQFLADLNRGNEYGRCTLRAVLTSVSRYLSEKRYPYNIHTDANFSNTRAILSTKVQKMNRPIEDQVSPHEITLMYENKVVGTHNPRALLNAIFLASVQLGTTSKRKLYEAKLGDWEIILYQHSDGTPPLEYIMCKHSDKHDTWLPANLDEPERCPVRHFRVYKSHRDKHLNQPDASMFLQIWVRNPIAKNPRLDYTDDHWYESTRAGMNSLAGYGKDMFECAGLQAGCRSITNASYTDSMGQVITREPGMPLSSALFRSLAS